MRLLALLAVFGAAMFVFAGPAGAAPSNDSFVNAQTLAGDTGSWSGPNTSATKQGGEPSIPGDGTVWFKWTAPNSTREIVDTNGSYCYEATDGCQNTFTSGVDTIMAVYSGSWGSLSLVDMNDDCGSALRWSCLAINPTPGTTYYIQVSTSNADGPGAAIVINWMQPQPSPVVAPPANDPNWDTSGGTPVAHTATPTFTFQDHSQEFTCSIDDATQGPLYDGNCTSPWVPPVPLSDGHHTFTVGPVGDPLVSAPTVLGFIVSTVTPPPVPTITSSTASAGSTSASFTFTDARAGVTFLCTIDGSPWSPCSSPASYSGLAEGAHHVFAVEAQDAGGTSPGYDGWNWTIGDLTAPPAPVVNSGPPNGTMSTSASLAFSDTEAGVAFYCSLDGAPATICSSPGNYSGLSVGAHSFSVFASDAAGNRSSSADYSWSIAPATGCDLGEGHGHFESTSPKINIEVEGDCDLQKKTGMLFIHHAKVKLDDKTIKGGKQMDVKVENDEDKPKSTGDIQSIRFNAAGDMVMSGVSGGQPFTVTLHDGGKGNGNKMDTVRLQWGAYDTSTLQQKHADVQVKPGE